jgi:hypothetical protein
VKELTDAAATTAYYNGLVQANKGGGPVPGLGQAAFVAPNGNALVRKDYKVLLVDITGLPPKFGQPPIARGDVAFRVAYVIMGCWTGA